MNFYYLFKYGGVFSVPLFSTLIFILISGTENFSPTKNTVSDSIHFLRTSTHKNIFRVSFLIKSFLDLSFSLYLIDHLKISYFSLLGFSLLVGPVLFALTGYSTEKRQTLIHAMTIYGYVILLLLSQLLLSLVVMDLIFILYTVIQAVVTALLVFGSFVRRSTNICVQIICILISYLWTLIFCYHWT